MADGLADRILEYIKAHPDTGDNMESVQEWWQGLMGLDPSMDRLTIKLEELNENGKIVKVDFGQDVFIYNIA